MKHRLLLLASLLLGSLRAQQPPTVNVRVLSDPAFGEFIVDGQTFQTAATFTWAIGSKHTLSVEPEQAPLQNAFYLFTGWADSTGRFTTDQTSVTITATREVTEILARFTATYRFQLKFRPCPASAAEAAAVPVMGAVWVNGSRFTCDVDEYRAANSQINLRAEPDPGYLFLGWLPLLSPEHSFLATVNLTGPTIVTAIFSAGRPVTLRTEPSGLDVVVDRTATPTPATLDMVPNRAHTIGTAASVMDREGRFHVIDSWVAASGQSGIAGSAYHVGPLTNVPDTITVRYTPAVQVRLRTSPVGLRLRIDGRDDVLPFNPEYGLTMGVGRTIEVSAPAEQVDSRGARYAFRSWSNGGPATQQVTLTSAMIDAGGLRLTALYEPLPRLTLSTHPAGLPIQVDGAACPTPCRIERPVGTTLRVAVSSRISQAPGTRLDLQAWSDGAGAERTVTVPAVVTELVARYRLSHELALEVEPAEAGEVTISPASPDNYYPGGQAISAFATTKPGFRFSRWSGVVSDTESAVPVLLSRPGVLRAEFEVMPVAVRTTVENAAGPTPEEGVAAGSLVAVRGREFAASLLTGPASPLAQTLGGVAVRVADRILPLVAVSPDRILALLPPDLPEGTYTALVSVNARTDVSDNFVVLRNAPGLFTRPVEGEGPMAMGSHPDGSEVTTTRPASRTETLTLLGTGFGPYQRMVPFGFAAPAGPPNPVEDRIELLVNGVPVEAATAVVAPNQVGMVAVRFRLPEGVPSGMADVQVRVGGRSSNAVRLPVQ